MYTKEVNKRRVDISINAGSSDDTSAEENMAIPIIIVNFNGRELYFEWDLPLNTKTANKIFDYLERNCANEDSPNYDATLLMVYLFS